MKCQFTKHIIFLLTNVHVEDQATYLLMYSPVSTQPHVQHLKQLTCHCLSRASRDWPCLISSPQPAQSEEGERRASQWQSTKKACLEHFAERIYVFMNLPLCPCLSGLPISAHFSPPSFLFLCWQPHFLCQMELLGPGRWKTCKRTALQGGWVTDITVFSKNNQWTKSWSRPRSSIWQCTSFCSFTAKSISQFSYLFKSQSLLICHRFLFLTCLKCESLPMFEMAIMLV